MSITTSITERPVVSPRPTRTLRCDTDRLVVHPDSAVPETAGQAGYLRERARQGSLSYPTFRRLSAFDLEAAQAVIHDVSPGRKWLAALCGDLAAMSCVEVGVPPEDLSELLFRLDYGPSEQDSRFACVRAALAIAEEEGLDTPWHDQDARLLRYVTLCTLDPQLADTEALSTLLLEASQRTGVPRWVAYVAGAAGDSLAGEMISTKIEDNHLLGPRRHTLAPIWRTRIEREVSAWALGFRDPLFRRSWTRR